jgi:HEAT repeat protein
MYNLKIILTKTCLVLFFIFMVTKVHGEAKEENQLDGLLKAKVLKVNATDSEIVRTFRKEINSEKDWRLRTNLVRSISRYGKLREEPRAKLILDALRRECEMPIKEIKGEGIPPYLTKTIREGYMYDLINIGPNVKPFLLNEIMRDSGEVRERITVTLGLMKEKSVFRTLIDIVEKSGDGWVRALAARSLGEFNNKEAITVLKKALIDSFFINEKGDVVPPRGYEYMKIRYPVRQESFFSLKKLGVKVRKKGSNINGYHEYVVDE